MLENQMLLNISVKGGQYFLYALALSLLLYPLRIFHAALGGIVAVAGYALVLLVNQAGWPVPFAVAFSVLLAMLTGVIMEVLVYRPLYVRGASTLAVAISSFAVYLVMVNAVAGLFSSQQSVVQGSRLTFSNDGFLVTSPQFITLLATIVAFLFMTVGLRSNLGCAVRAMEDSPDLLRTCGHDIMTIRRTCILASSALGGLAGCLAALDTGIEPGMGMIGLLNALVIVVAVGSGAYRGLLPVALLLAMLQHVFTYYISARWESAVSFVVLTGFLVFRPHGLFTSGRRAEELV